MTFSSQVVLSLYLAQSFVGEIGVTKASCCYGNYAAIGNHNDTLVILLS